MSVTINCGFVRALILSGCCDNHSSSVYDQILVDYRRLFQNFPNFWTLENDRRLKDRFKDYRTFIRSKPEVNKEVKATVKSSFSQDKWTNLSVEEKLKHSLQNCKVRMIFVVARFIF